MSDREALMRPFTDAEVQWRPGAAKWDHKPSCEGPKCRETGDPSKHMQLAYVEDEQVMDRLDEGFGPGYWQILTDAIDHSVVKVRLGVCYDLEHWVWYEDFGYANREGGDVLKEAVTDGIRRCGRFVGIARDLYRKGASHTTSGQQRVGAPRAAAPASPPRSVVPLPPAGEAPEEPEYLTEIIGAPHTATVTRVADEVASQDGFCPQHGLAWVLQPGGISKTTGKPYDGFWKCPSDERPWCKEKPSKRWAALMEMAS
jgi:hypothetical protein